MPMTAGSAGSLRRTISRSRAASAAFWWRWSLSACPTWCARSNRSLQDLDKEVEEAAASLGASRWQTMRRVLLPAITPAILTGFALAFARALGEYGSVIFISDNIPLKSEIVPVVIVSRRSTRIQLRRRHGHCGGYAGGIVRAASGHQSLAAQRSRHEEAPHMSVLEEKLPAGAATRTGARSTSAATKPFWVRALHLLLALAFLTLFLVLPLICVFAQALPAKRLARLCGGDQRSQLRSIDAGDAAHGSHR